MNIKPDTQEDIDEFNANIEDNRLHQYFLFIVTGAIILAITPLFTPSIAGYIHAALDEQIRFFLIHFCINLFIILFVTKLSNITGYLFFEQQFEKRRIPAWVGIYFNHSKKVINDITEAIKYNNDKYLRRQILRNLEHKYAQLIGRSNFNEYKKYEPIILPNKITFLDEILFTILLLAFFLVNISQKPNTTYFYIALYLQDIGLFSNLDSALRFVYHNFIFYSLIAVGLIGPYFLFPFYKNTRLFETSIIAILNDQKIQNRLLFRRWFFFIAGFLIFSVLGISSLFSVYDLSLKILNNEAIEAIDRYLMAKMGRLMFPSLLFSAIIMNTYTVYTFRDIGIIVLSFFGFKFKR